MKRYWHTIDSKLTNESSALHHRNSCKKTFVFRATLFSAGPVRVLLYFKCESSNLPTYRLFFTESIAESYLYPFNRVCSECSSDEGTIYADWADHFGFQILVNLTETGLTKIQQVSAPPLCIIVNELLYTFWTLVLSTPDMIRQAALVLLCKC